MKSIFYILILIVLPSCRMFDEKREPIISYKLNSTTEIKISSMGYGATTKDFTEIRLVTTDRDDLIKRIEGSYSDYKTNIVRINDTLFKVTFTDTSVFKGMSRSFQFSLNERVKQ